MWIYRIYFTDDHELFEYDALGNRGTAATQWKLPYLESLLSFLEMDCTALIPRMQELCENWKRFFSTGNRIYSTQAMQMLGAFGGQHVYFQLIYLRWYERMALGNLAPEMEDELRLLPDQLTAYQKQAQKFLENILDIDRVGRDTQRNARKNYWFDQSQNTEPFCFKPMPINFEPVSENACGAVLYPNTIRDLIDFALRDCVTREIPVRRCRNCGRYFPLTGRVTAEYCSRPNSTRKPCRNTGAAQRWESSRQRDQIFKEYRREYKRHFAWIKAGKISEEEFVDWSRKARKKRQECETEGLSFDEFKAWLKNS